MSERKDNLKDALKISAAAGVIDTLDQLVINKKTGQIGAINKNARLIRALTTKKGAIGLGLVVGTSAVALTKTIKNSNSIKDFVGNSINNSLSMFGGNIAGLIGGGVALKLGLKLRNLKKAKKAATSVKRNLKLLPNRTDIRFVKIRGRVIPIRTRKK